MPSKPKRRSGVRHGTRNFILRSLEPTKSGTAVSTPDLIAQVRKLSGKSIPEETIRASLRTLVKNGVVGGRKVGRQKVYRLARSGSTTAAPAQRHVRKRAPRMVEHTGVIEEVSFPHEPELPSPEPASSVTVGATAPSQALSVPHKLAVGEALVLHVGETHVETATNVHGKIVLERHRRVNE